MTFSIALIGNFNPRAPRGARRADDLQAPPACLDFNPRAPRGARPFQNRPLTSRRRFQSTRPARGATDEGYMDLMGVRFQSTRPARGATSGMGWRPKSKGISIHAPREGRDRLIHLRPSVHLISIHAPREGRDRHPFLLFDAPSQFQSTRPARGATPTSQPSTAAIADFNPRAPRGARPLFPFFFGISKYFNPRAPRGARLSSAHSQEDRSQHFNPRAPRGARRIAGSVFF